VYSARFAGEGASYADNVAKLLADLKGEKGPAARRARFRTVALAAWPDGREIAVEGVVNGTIAEVARGRGGFGYDPVFIPDEGDGRTYAELADDSPAAKHRLSHRGRAFEALAGRLASLT
jgi:XTP/dITP diphosphohydrolase